MTNKKNTKETVSQAMGAYMKESFEESIKLFSEALSNEPEHKISLVSRGSAYLRLKQLDNAMADFDRAIELHPDYARAHHLRGLAKEGQGDELAALAEFDRAIALDGEYGAAYASRASVHQKLGHEDLATNDLAMATTLTQVNLETFANENNIWHSHHMRVEDAMETELNR